MSSLTITPAERPDSRRIRAYQEKGGIKCLYILYHGGRNGPRLPPTRIVSEMPENYDETMLMAVRAGMMTICSAAGFSPFVPIRIYTGRMRVSAHASNRDSMINAMFHNRHQKENFTFKGDFWAIFPLALRLFGFKIYPNRGFYKGPNAIKVKTMQEQLGPFAIDTTGTHSKGSWRPAFFAEVIGDTFSNTTQNPNAKPIVVRNDLFRHLIHASMSVEAPKPMLMSYYRMLKENNGHYTFSKDNPEKSLRPWSERTVTHVYNLMGVDIPNTGIMYHIGSNFEPGKVKITDVDPDSDYPDDSCDGKAPHFKTYESIKHDKISDMIKSMGRSNPSAVAILESMVCKTKGEKRSRESTRRVKRPVRRNGVVVFKNVPVERKVKRRKTTETEDDERTDTDDDDEDEDKVALEAPVAISENVNVFDDLI